MFFRFVFCISLFFAATCSKYLFAQTFNPRYNFKHLNIQNGLAQNIVYHFLQDSRGYMWIGTRNGLTLYDGVRTINFVHDEQNSKSLSGNFITRIVEDSAKQIWIGTNMGIDRYNRAENNFTHYQIERENSAKENSFVVPLAFIDSTEMWFIDPETKAIRSFNSKTKLFKLIASVNITDGSLVKNTSDNTIQIWSYLDIGTSHLTFKNNTLIRKESYFSGKPESRNKMSLQVVHAFQQNDTAVWLSTNGGLVRLHPVTGQYSIFNNWQGRIINEMRFSALSPTGLLWVGTGPDGIYTFDTKTERFVDNFRKYELDPFSICSNNIVSLYFDRVGNIWCGSYGNGLSYANVNINFFSKHLSKKETGKWSMSNHVGRISKDYNKNIWCIMEGLSGLLILDSTLAVKDQRLPVLPDGSRFTGTITKLLFNSDNTAWCITNAGLFLYKISNNVIQQVHFPLLSDQLFGSNWLNDIIRLKNGSIIFSTYAGLYRIVLKDGKFTAELFSPLNKAVYTGVDMLFEDREGYLYVKSRSPELYVLKPNEKTKEFNLVRTFDLVAAVSSFQQDENGRVYVATDNGLYAISENKKELQKVFPNAQSSFSNISFLLQKKGQLWLFGEQGLHVFDIEKKTGSTFTIEDGLPSNEFSFDAVIMLNDSTVVAGTSNGLVSFQTSKLRETIYPPIAQLTGIRINDEEKSFVPNAQEATSIQLSHWQNTFSFDFASIVFQHASSCTYEYMLEGYDKTWIKSSPAQYTRYSKIPPGDYNFQLRVTDANGKISPYTKSLKIQISKAFWQTWVFKIFVAAVLLVGLFYGIKAYMAARIRKQRQHFEQQQAIEKERTRIATDMHDDLGAGLSRIKYLSESIQLKKANDESIKNDIEKIAGYSDEMVEKMGEIVWALNERNDTLADLISFTRSYAAEYLSNHNIQCNFYTPDILPVSFVTGELRRNIFLSVKESLHNIVKHAKAASVSIYVDIDKALQVIIHDDGVGIDKSNIRPFSNGLTNIKKRMKEVGGKAEIENANGTRVMLSVPIGE